MKNKNKIRVIAALVFALWAKVLIPSGHSDAYIRDRVVKLTGNHIGCSGEQVRAPSGVDYILTAGHCDAIAVNGSMTVELEDGRTLSRKVIAEDSKSDLLLLEGVPNLPGLDIGNYSYRFQKVRTFTHGRMMATYKTDGTLVGYKSIKVAVGPVDTAAEETKCSGEKFVIEEADFGFRVCVMSVQEMASTAEIMPGSSGGPMVNSVGDLVGVASATGDGFHWFVTLSDIRDFIKSY